MLIRRRNCRTFTGCSASQCPVAHERTWFRLGFTFVESMIAMIVVALAGAALLTSVASAVTACNDSVFQTVGRGLGEQLLAEISAAKFPTGAMMPMTGPTRAAFQTFDDYSNFVESPPRTKGGELLGADQSNGTVSSTTSGTMMMSLSPQRPQPLRAADDFMNRFSRRVLVERVQPAASGGWSVTTQPTSYRRVTVFVSYTIPGQNARTVAELTRIFAAIPAAL